MIALAVLVSRVSDITSANTDFRWITWVAGGILLAFVILAGFSIGPYLFPAMLAFWFAAIASDLRQRRIVLRHLVLGVVAAGLQGVLIGLLLLLSSAMRG